MTGRCDERDENDDLVERDERDERDERVNRPERLAGRDPRPLRIGVSGGGDDADARAMDVARRLGAALARGGAVVLCGGLGGVMRACAEGARAAGGLTVGILPGDRAGEANPAIILPIVTDLGHARNVVLVHSSEALVAVGGSYGTLSEIALALKIGVPVATLDSFDAHRAGLPAPPIERSDDPEEAAAWALAAARALRAARGEASR